jgi:hypothetical protein
MVLADAELVLKETLSRIGEPVCRKLLFVRIAKREQRCLKLSEHLG